MNLLAFIEPIFAQQKGVPKGPDFAVFGGMMICYLVVIVIAIAIHIMFLLNLSKTLALCSPRNRTMEPGMVWLNLVPFLNIVWIFLTIIRLSESLQNEFRTRGLRSDDPEFGKMTGILYVVLSWVCGPVGLVFFIMYWLKINGFRNQLASGRRGKGGDTDADDYDDERPRRRRPAADDDDDDDRPQKPRRRDDDE